MVKTYFCDGFENIVRDTPVPLVVAGGKKIPEKDAIQLAWNAVNAGARGVDMGRNIFQSDSPTGMIQAVRGVVHNNMSVKEAHQLYQEIKG
jgi:putative autoinducer-2 (AI-2) aldolase